MTRRWLIRSTGIIGVATASSRILGFIRDIIIAVLFGTNPEAQAFFVAFRIPNSLRDLVGEGATNAAVVPVLTEYKTLGDEREFIHVSRVLFNVSFAALVILTVLGVISSPAIVRLVAPGFLKEPPTFELAVRLNRLIFPYLILIGLTAYTMGVLNTLRHFAAPAFGPCLLNMSLIVSALWLCPKIGVYGLAVGVLAGGVLQLFLNVPVMYKNGVTLNFKDGFRHRAVKRIGVLLVPRLLGSAVYQVNIFVDTILASLAWIVGIGGVAALYYANRLVQFPLAIFALALAQAALPKMSREFAVNDTEALKNTIFFSLKIVSLVMIPSSFAFAILGAPIIRVLFERGEFTAYSTAITQNALFFYSFGLFAYSGIKLLVSCFYSMHDTMTPVKTASIAVVLNIVLNLILMWPLKLGGLALATSISATFNFLMLYIALKRKIGDFGTKKIIDCLLRVISASLVMAIVLKLIGTFAFSVNAQAGILMNLAALFGSIIVGLMVFLFAAYIFGVKELREGLEWVTKRF